MSKLDEARLRNDNLRKARELSLVAISELEFSDYVCIRCQKQNIDYPQEWKTRDSTLRLFVNMDKQSLSDNNYTMPVRPSLPWST